MRARPAVNLETYIRAAILPGAVVAVLGLVGVDVVSKTPTNHDRPARAAWIGARSMSSGTGIVRAATNRLAWTAAVLLLLLAVGQPIDIAPPESRSRRHHRLVGTVASAQLRRRHSISYHTGGRNGP